jgi:hypothetical protein
VPAQIRYRNEQGKIEVEEESSPAEKEIVSAVEKQSVPPRPHRIYAYGVARNRLRQAAQELVVPIQILDDLEGADAVITLKSYYRSRPRLLTEAEDEGIPVYVLRANTLMQIQNLLVGIFDLDDSEDRLSRALRETQDAIRRVNTGTKMVELTPQNAYIRRQQHEMARSFRLISHSRGKEPHRRVRIYRE